MAEKTVLDCSCCQQVRLLLLHEFNKQISASIAVDNICGTIGPTAVSYHTAKLWFRKFKNGDVCLEDRPQAGRPVAFWNWFRRRPGVAPVN
ncbi:unnamed protein product [Heligmosomoides polygyrus]|uniref:HTH_48 domain-containing protein n=1 Tax=Heligmosomoides polygyrus TaxID=6339 RepID=A0A183F576_HELPZ|nr:unnamed protein product [Heligmosomoides polygyrus]